MKTDGRRIKLLRMSPTILVSLFAKGNHFYEVVDDPMPEDATIVNAYSDSRSGQVIFQVHSATFPPMDEGSHFYDIEPKFRTYMPGIETTH